MEKNRKTFGVIKPTRGDISFAENDQFAILRLKRSKTDVDHKGVQIMLAATNNHTCPVRALRHLFQTDIQLPQAPLFRVGTAFTKQTVITILRKRLIAAEIPDPGYSGHSFRRGAAQHAADNGMLKENIQKLGRWTSNAFQLYFETSQASVFNLNLSFQKGMPLAVPRATYTSTPSPPSTYSTSHLGTSLGSHDIRMDPLQGQPTGNAWVPPSGQASYRS